MSIEGELRFLSHHDMMRAMERLVRRAALPLRYSQGFNPRPALSLTMPRPVGVASRADLMVLTLEEEIEPQTVLDRVNATSPEGLRATRARKLASNPRPRSARYEMPLAEERLPSIRARLDELAGMDCWPLERKTSSDPDSKAPTTTIDLRKLVRELHLACDEGVSPSRGTGILPASSAHGQQIRANSEDEGETPSTHADKMSATHMGETRTGRLPMPRSEGSQLAFTLAPLGESWAKPSEVLALMGLDARGDLASVTRISVDYGIQENK